MFEVVGKNDRSGEILNVFRELDNNGGTIAGTEFVLIANNILVDDCDYDIDAFESYRHVTVLDVGGFYEIKDMPYKCDPLPSESSNWFLMKHADNKEWAIKECNTGELLSLFRNEHTEGRWVHTPLSNTISMGKRIEAKKNRGYVLTSSNTKTWKGASKAFSN